MFWVEISAKVFFFRSQLASLTFGSAQPLSSRLVSLVDHQKNYGGRPISVKSLHIYEIALRSMMKPSDLLLTADTCRDCHTWDTTPSNLLQPAISYGSTKLSWWQHTLICSVSLMAPIPTTVNHHRQETVSKSRIQIKSNGPHVIK